MRCGLELAGQGGGAGGDRRERGRRLGRWLLRRLHRGWRGCGEGGLLVFFWTTIEGMRWGHEQAYDIELEMAEAAFEPVHIYALEVLR